MPRWLPNLCLVCWLASLFIPPGRWRVRQGLDLNDDQQMDADTTLRLVDVERGESLQLIFSPQKNTVVQLELVTPAATDYTQRPDLGINPADVKVQDDTVAVRIYTLGAVDAPATSLVLTDAKGNRVAAVPVPPLNAPLYLLPIWIEVKIPVSANTDLRSGNVELDPEKKMNQITRVNDRVKW